MPESKTPEIPQVIDKRARIAGLLPKHAQSLLVAGIALVMILVILFSGSNTPKAKPKTMDATSLTTQPSQARIQEYRNAIDEQARRLNGEDAQLARTKETLGLQSAPPPAPFAQTPVYRSYAPVERIEPQQSWVDKDREKRQYQSLFASNIALSYRTPATPSGLLSASRSQAAGFAGSSDSRGSSAASAAGDQRSGAAAANPTPSYRIFEGTVLEAVLTNRLDGTFSGPVNCMVTTDVYSYDGAKLLIPQGARVLGEVKKLETFGQGRLAMVFHRLFMPDGFSVSLDQLQGLDQVGETGLSGNVNHHYLQLFGVSIAIGAIAGMAQVNSGYGINQSAADAYQQGVASSLSQSSLHILDHYLNVLPTMTIPEGKRVKIYLSQDLVLPAYDQHPVRDDL